MCVIALIPAGQELTADQAKAMWHTNDDGAGFGWVDRHNQMRVKTFMEFDAFWNAYKGTVQGYRDREFLVHFRIGTHGTKDITNVHPFRVDHNTIMAHNGIIRCVQDFKDGRSDTRVFVEETLPKFPELWLDIPELRWVVEDAIGGSKLAFLTNNPRLSQTSYVLNRAAGTELENGIWVSNKSWEYALPGRTKTVSTYGQSIGNRVGMGGGGNWYPMGNGVVQKYQPYGYGDILDAEEVAAIEEQDSRATVKRDLVVSAVAGFDVFKMKGMIEDQRAKNGYTQEVTFMDGEWTCWGCYHELDNAGVCGCFDAVCLDCHDFAEYCKCNMDTKNIVDIDEILKDPEKFEDDLDGLGGLSDDLGELAALFAIPDEGEADLIARF